MSEEPLDWRTDADLEADDLEAARMQREIRFNERVSDKAEELRIFEAAKARVRAEKVAAADYDSLFLDRGQLVNLPTPEPLIDRVLPRHAYAILRGRDHSFKSFVAIDWACSLATGRRWQDHDTETTRVLYVAGEGAHGLRSRIDAWEYAWGRHVPDDMLTIRTAALDLHQPGPAFDHLLTHVTTGGYGLIVIDTLRRVSGAADGNSSEMGAVIDNLDRLKRATLDGTVLTVAHTDKGDHDTRGYSGIEDDADVVWAAKRDDMDLALELTKYKDGPDGRTLHLAAQRTLTSLTLADLGGPREADTTETQSLILDALRIMPTGGVTGPELMATAGIKSRATFYRGLKDLQPHHVTLIEQGRRKYYELTQPSLDDVTSDQEHDPTDDAVDPQLPTSEDP